MPKFLESIYVPVSVLSLCRSYLNPLRFTTLGGAKGYTMKMGGKENNLLRNVANYLPDHTVSLNRITSNSEIHVAYGYSLVVFHVYIM
jgi:hypothetical protein